MSDLVNNNKYEKKIVRFIIFWDWLTVHIWLLCFKFDIIFAFLSFLQDIGALSETIDKIGNCTMELHNRNCYGEGIIFNHFWYIFYFFEYDIYMVVKECVIKTEIYRTNFLYLVNYLKFLLYVNLWMNVQYVMKIWKIVALLL